jgi:hypothetical protein
MKYKVIVYKAHINVSFTTFLPELTLPTIFCCFEQSSAAPNNFLNSNISLSTANKKDETK